MIRSSVALLCGLSAFVSCSAVEANDPSSAGWFGFFAGSMLVLALLKNDTENGYI